MKFTASLVLSSAGGCLSSCFPRAGGHRPEMQKEGARVFLPFNARAKGNQRALALCRVFVHMIMWRNPGPVCTIYPRAQPTVNSPIVLWDAAPAGAAKASVGSISTVVPELFVHVSPASLFQCSV